MNTVYQAIPNLLTQLDRIASLLRGLPPTVTTWLAGLGVVSLLLVAFRILRSAGSVALLCGMLGVFYVVAVQGDAALAHVLDGLRVAACDIQDPPGIKP